MTDECSARVHASFARQGFMSLLGASITAVATGRCHIRAPYSDTLTQQHGFYHGGVTAALADNAAGFAAYSMMEADAQPLSIEFKINLLAPAQGAYIEARGEVLRAGRRLVHARADVFTLSDSAATHVATALATIAVSHSVRER